MLRTHFDFGGNTCSHSPSGVRLMVYLVAVTTAGIALTIAFPARAQTTLTWATPGVSPDIGTGGNWVGGVAPNFAGDATTDSAIFSASTNTTVRLRNVTTGDPFATVTFDAAAPAYNFTLPIGNTLNELVILPLGNMTNNSINTQSFTGVAAVNINSEPASVGTLFATSGNAGTKLSFDLNQLKFNNAGGTNVANLSAVDLSAGFDVRTVTLNGVANAGVSSSLNVVGNLLDGTGGTLFITGDSGTNLGRLILNTGAKVRISHNNALGDPTITVPSTTSDNETRIGNGGTNNSRVELTGNITVNEGFFLGARQNNQPLYDNNRSPHILNVSGNNTLTGSFAFGTGGNSYNFGSDAGTLTIQSNLPVPTSAERYITFQRASSINVTGNIIGGPATGGTNDGVGLVKYDSGTTTLSGAANEYIAGISIRGGTLALGASAVIGWAPFSSDTFAFLPPRVDVYAGATFDVSAKGAGGYNLSQTLQGDGTVIGTINMGGGTQVLPGATEVYDGQGMSWFDYSDVVGKLTFQSGGLNLSSGSSMVWQLGALSTANPGVDFDQIVVGGNLALGGTSNLTLDFSLVSAPDSGDPFWSSARSWKIIDTTTNTGNTNFASITNGIFGSAAFTTLVGTGANAGDIFLNYSPTAAHPGDFDGDGDVDGADFVAWQTNFPTSSGATLAQGDADGDGDVDGADFVVWQTNFPFTPGPGVAPVPEPSLPVLMLSAGAWVVFRARKRRTGDGTMP